MGGRGHQSDENGADVRPKGFDDFDLTLGDVMRGERATLGKSLLDVQRDLKIRAPHIAAIENADHTAFDTPSFVPGFVRSYARYLNLDPEWAFAQFCKESGFAKQDGMAAGSASAGGERKSRSEKRVYLPATDALAASKLPFKPAPQSAFADLEPRAIGSSLVLAALIGGLGYGAWAVVQEVQRVTVTPVDQRPVVESSVGSFSNVQAVSALSPDQGLAAPTQPAPPTTDALERLYRPAALDVPVMVPRDAPIASLNPEAQGIFAIEPRVDALPKWPQDIQVLAGPAPEVLLVATEPTWVRVESPGQSVVYEQVLEPGESYAIPVTEETPTLRADNAGALYFKVNGTLVGPAGGESDGRVTDLRLASTDLSVAFPAATPLADSALFDLLRELGSPDVLPGSDADADVVTLVALGDSWVRVRDGDNAVVFEDTLTPAAHYTLPDDLSGATLARAGNSGALYFQVGDAFYGPAGEDGRVAKGVSLDADAIREVFGAVDGAKLGLIPAIE